MADMLRHQQRHPTEPSPIPQSPQTKLAPPSQSVTIPQASPGIRSGHLNRDAFSPVNQKGHFEFDRVLKCGIVNKRTRKTKVGSLTIELSPLCKLLNMKLADLLFLQQWRSHYLVLRPNLLSIYKSASEEKLLKQLTLSDLTAVAYLKDPKNKRQHVFGLFSPSRNFHLQTSSAEETRSWVELIKQEARIDEEEQGLIYGSPTQYKAPFSSMMSEPEHERYGSSSPEPFDGTGGRRPSMQEADYSGNEMGSYSDFSEAPSTMQKQRKTSPHHVALGSRSYPPPQVTNPSGNASQLDNSMPDADDERVLWHGWLLCLKSRSGVRQWKRLWAVLRSKNLTFYKGEEEYAALLLIPLSNIISAGEIDPVSRSKAHCMQIIAEDRSYRFCAPSEESLARWLGALKSQLAKKRDRISKQPTL